MITMIAAAGEKNELGKDNDLVWHLPDDFKRFKKLTTGHPIIMGRKTYESFPKPLPNRLHIIITRNEDYAPSIPEGREKDVLVVTSMDAALLKAMHDEQPFIIGGGEIYNLGMEVADKIELTRVHSTFDADTFFPEINKSQWEKISEIRHEKDEKHNFAFTYETWERK
jgi:dihydrofolate reductase